MFQYAFCCNEEEEVTWMSTLIQVDDGTVHIINIRYVLVTVMQLIAKFQYVCVVGSLNSGYLKKKRKPNY